MGYSVYDLKAFYSCRKGRLIQPLLMKRIESLWPDAKGLRVLGMGYAVPFLTPYLNGAERVAAMMPERLGVHLWTPDGMNRAFLSADCELPIETESVDRILVVHGLEHADAAGPYLDEVWRVLKSTGRALIVVPNRRGLWSRAEWSPFGHGVPYSTGQLVGLLKDHLFTIEHVDRALFLPPLRSSLLTRSLLSVDRLLGRILPGLGGVIVIEAGKQIYGAVAAGRVAGAGLRRGGRVFVPAATARGG